MSTDDVPSIPERDPTTKIDFENYIESENATETSEPALTTTENKALSLHEVMALLPRQEAPDAYSQSKAPCVQLDPAQIKPDKRFAHRTIGKIRLDALRQDILANGIVVPVIVDVNYTLIHGYARLGIAIEGGFKTVPAIVLPVAADDIPGIGLSLQTSTTLGALDRAELVLRFLDAEKAAAKERQRAAGRNTGLRNGKNAPEQPTPDYSHAKGNADAILAKRLGSSTNTVRKLKQIEACEYPDLLERLYERERPSISAVYKELQRRRIREKIAAEPVAVSPDGGLFTNFESIPTGKYRTIYADPPWAYANKAPYPTMTVEELTKLNPKSLAHESGAFLLMWTTWPMLRKGVPQALLSAWGFEWIGEFVWKKTTGGYGGNVTVLTEVLILARLGKPTFLGHEPGFIEALNREHSKKPPQMYEMIQRCCPGPHLELFGRVVPEGWDGWGNEVARPQKPATPNDIGQNNIGAVG